VLHRKRALAPDDACEGVWVSFANVCWESIADAFWESIANVFRMSRDD
jgi:hypothetical protein